MAHSHPQSQPTPGLITADVVIESFFLETPNQRKSTAEGALPSGGWAHAQRVVHSLHQLVHFDLAVAVRIKGETLGQHVTLE